jgi:hypothetical protein
MNVMAKIREALLGIALIATASVVAAGPIGQGKIKSLTANPECPSGAAWKLEALGDTGQNIRFAQDADEDNISGGSDSIIEDYLSFHAQATEENGKFSLMPWSGLRTHAN